MQTIKILPIHYNLLRQWASVGRTIDSAISELVDYNTEQSQYTAGELIALKAALDACGCAAKT